MPFISAEACRIDTPALNLATTPRKCPPRDALAGFNASGRQNSASPTNVNPAGITPTIVTGAPLSVMVWPRTSAFPLNRVCHMPWLRTMTASLPGASSSARNDLPSDGLTPSNSNVSHDTSPPVSRCGPSFPFHVAPVELNAAIRSKTAFCCRQSRKVAGATEKRPYCGTISWTRTSEPGFGYGNGRSSTPLTTVKIALLAPMPSDKVRIATMVKPGVRRS